MAETAQTLPAETLVTALVRTTDEASRAYERNTQDASVIERLYAARASARAALVAGVARLARAEADYEAAAEGWGHGDAEKASAERDAARIAIFGDAELPEAP